MIKLQKDNGIIKDYKDEYHLFFELLQNKQIDYAELTETYIKYLEQKEEIQRIQLSETDMPLIETYKKSNHLSVKNTKDCIVRYLVNYSRFENTPIQEELKKYVKDNNINLNGRYYKDLYLEKSDGNE